tara:strand:- start:52593 stop:53669 length:1077 start_codon:yes stop_codon:yes gene_type:complete
MATRFLSSKLDRLAESGIDIHPIGLFELDQFSPIGDRPVVIVDLNAAKAASIAAQFRHLHHAVILGVESEVSGVEHDCDAYDVLLTTSPERGAPYVEVAPDALHTTVTRLEKQIRANPAAAMILCQVLRMGEALSYDQALLLESLAYATLLGGGEFKRWLESRATARSQVVDLSEPLVLIEREQNCVRLTLNSPGTRNAMSAGMRDALFECLANVVEDPTEPSLVLRAQGKCFSVGGDLAEFGSATDLALAHSVRTLRSCAQLLADLGDRASVVVHGACIGSGIEIAAAAAHRIATAGTYVHLPEVGMGLIPGAGGTVSLPAAIGRHRTAYLALSGKRIRAETISDWGLFEHHDVSQP